MGIQNCSQNLFLADRKIPGRCFWMGRQSDFLLKIMLVTIWGWWYILFIVTFMMIMRRWMVVSMITTWLMMSMMLIVVVDMVIRTEAQLKRQVGSSGQDWESHLSWLMVETEQSPSFPSLSLVGVEELHLPPLPLSLHQGCHLRMAPSPATKYSDEHFLSKIQRFEI